FLGAFGLEGLAVEEGAAHGPFLHPKAEAIGKPQVVKAEVLGKVFGLTPQEGAEADSFRDSIWEAGVWLAVGLEFRVAVNESTVPHLPEPVAMALILEAALGELGPRVKGSAN